MAEHKVKAVLLETWRREREFTVTDEEVDEWLEGVGGFYRLDDRPAQIEAFVRITLDDEAHSHMDDRQLPYDWTPPSSQQSDEIVNIECDSAEVIG